MFRVIIALLVASALLLSACQSTVPAEGQGEEVEVGGGFDTEVSVSEFQSMLKNKDFTLVNVHIPYEGNIPKTNLSISYDGIDHNLNQFPTDKNAKIVLYCRSDNMSTTASETLIGLAVTVVFGMSISTMLCVRRLAALKVGETLREL